MRRKKAMLIVMLILSIAFASVSTSLVISGTATISGNTDNFNIYFSSASISNGTVTGVNTQILTFNTDTLSLVGDTSTVEYTVFNDSTEYDANVTINCTSSSSDYYTVVSQIDGTTIESSGTSFYLASQKKKSGIITVTLVKAYAMEEVTSDTFTCTLSTSAVSRDELTLTSIDNVDIAIRESSHTFYGGSETWSGDYHSIYLDVTNNTSTTLENFKIVLNFNNSVNTITQLIYYGAGIGKWDQDNLTYTIHGISSYTSGDEIYYSNISIASGETKSFGVLKVSSSSSVEMDIEDYLDYYVVLSGATKSDTSDRTCEGESSTLTCLDSYAEE